MIGISSKRIFSVTLLVAVLIGLAPATAEARGYGRYSDSYQEVLESSFYEMLGNLPSRFIRFGIEVRLVVLEDGEANAYATYVNGAPVVAVTTGMMNVVLNLAAHKANAEIYGESNEAFIRTIEVSELQALGEGTVIPPDGFSWKMSNDPDYARKVGEVFQTVFSYILGHELGHLSLGHVDSAYKYAGLNPRTHSYLDLHRAYRSQRNELCADQWGVNASAYGYPNLGYIELWTAYMRLVESYERKYYGRVPLYLRTHPDWDSREATINASLRAIRRSWGY